LLILGCGWLQAASSPKKSWSLLILGDSLTEGQGVEEQEAFPALLQKSFDQNYPGLYRIIPGGVSGSTTASAPSRLRWYARAKPDAVLLALGSNDGLRGVPIEETRRNLKTAIDFCREKGWIILLAGLQVPPNYGPEYAPKFRALFSELAREEELPYFEFLLEGVAGEIDMNQADGIHPNPAGHQKIAKNLQPFLVKHLGVPL
jgi:acyl-CoA thioesterase-1